MKTQSHGDPLGMAAELTGRFLAAFAILLLAWDLGALAVDVYRA